MFYPPYSPESHHLPLLGLCYRGLLPPPLPLLRRGSQRISALGRELAAVPTPGPVSSGPVLFQDRDFQFSLRYFWRTTSAAKLPSVQLRQGIHEDRCLLLNSRILHRNPLLQLTTQRLLCRHLRPFLIEDSSHHVYFPWVSIPSRKKGTWTISTLPLPVIWAPPRYR